MGNLTQLSELRAQLHVLAKQRWKKTDLLVGLMLVHECDERGAVVASYAKLAAETGLRKHAIGCAVNRLIEAGYLSRVVEGSCAYTFDIDRMRAGAPAGRPVATTSTGVVLRRVVDGESGPSKAGFRRHGHDWTAEEREVLRAVEEALADIAPRRLLAGGMITSGEAARWVRDRFDNEPADVARGVLRWMDSHADSGSVEHLARELARGYADSEEELYRNGGKLAGESGHGLGWKKKLTLNLLKGLALKVPVRPEKRRSMMPDDPIGAIAAMAAAAELAGQDTIAAAREGASELLAKMSTSTSTAKVASGGAR